MYKCLNLQTAHAFRGEALAVKLKHEKKCFNPVCLHVAIVM